MKHHQNDIICFCRNVTRAEVKEAIEQRHARSIYDLTWATGICGDDKCKDQHPDGQSCHSEAEKMIIAFHGELRKGQVSDCASGTCHID